jgi:hypothetical protein
MKIYYDAGLKELALKYHKGATLKSLIECSKFSMSHRFLLHMWEAMFRLQIELFFKSRSSDKILDFQNELEEVINIVLRNTEQAEAPNTCTWENILDLKTQFEGTVQNFKDDFLAWREHSFNVSDTFKFWDTFIHVDFMSYLGLYLAIRSRDWDLRNASLKKLCCLFYAFDRHNYMRMIPYHLADLSTFPKAVLEHFRTGCFSVSLSGASFYSVALDEAHEMEINLKTKKAINTYSQTSLAAFTAYLPYRAETMHNLKSQLELEKGDNHKRKDTAVGFIKEEEKTIRMYIDKLRVSSLFVTNIGKTLCHLFTQSEASPPQAESLLSYRELGTEDMKNYIECFLLRVTDLALKPPPRRRRNLKTFALPKVSVHKQKKEIKDNKTVIECLRKQIAFSKLTGKAVVHLDQFVTLPRAICDTSGIPEKGKKSNATKILKSWYGEAFISNLPHVPTEFTATILEGMFMINTSPLQQLHKTFADYAEFLFSRWVVKSHKTYNATQVHVFLITLTDMV